jgi:hypothetical protein
MGKLTPHFKTAMVEDIVKSIQSGSSYYYAFAANPDEWTGNTIPAETADQYTSYFFNNWTMLFGKKISNTDVFPVIRRITWASGTKYARYDDMSTSLANSDFYVVVNPNEEGGFYNIYKCIDNANNAASTSKPEQIQELSFTTADGYTWRYITSITNKVVKRFATDAYMPVYANAEMVESAYEYSGIDKVLIHSAGIGYDVYHQGTVLSVVNSTTLQISTTANPQTGYYTNNSIYFYSNTHPAQLKVVANSYANDAGIYVGLSSELNVAEVIPSLTNYYIGPQVKFNTDGKEQPSARAIVNTTTYGLQSIEILNTGYGVTRANVSIITSPYATATQNTSTGANVSCVPSPPGGHGANPVSELYAQGVAFNFNFSGTENGTIPTDVKYNKVGLIKNPYILTSNTAKGIAYTGNTFNSLINATLVSPPAPAAFTVSDIVTGQTTGSKAKIAFANSSVLKLVGDKNFLDGETIVDSSNNSTEVTVDFSSITDIYTKDLYPLYFQNIDSTERANTQVESFRIIIQV